MLDSKLQNLITKSYKEIQKISFINKVTEGYLSHNYILTANNKKYFLKQYREKYTEDFVKDIHKVINFFSKNNIPAVKPIEDINNQTFFIFNNRIYTIFPFINGIAGNRKTLNKKSIISLASTLANIHLLSTNNLPLQINSFEGPINRDYFLNTYPKIIYIIESKTDKKSFDKLALQVLRLKKRWVDKSKNRLEEFDVKKDHLLHGDYHEKNVLFDKYGEVKYLFDWEKTEIGDRLHEVIRSMDYVCLDGVYKKQNIDKARIYIQTYKQLYPFTKEDFLLALEKYYLKQAHSLWIERTHYLENSDRVDCFLKNELALLEYFPENIESLADKVF
jgi:Ser/Thr protein kinase RdoA (MazF antagonist)